ncbi:hypothetical protein KSP39_PZI002948 [Platanthera zijinensis]|uniref:Uncharacterized protein n=1 Tax=Platanthera zijinensis TaxID=2320716 RepID=A0AAP0GEI1_9ASPA
MDAPDMVRGQINFKRLSGLDGLRDRHPQNSQEEQTYCSLGSRRCEEQVGEELLGPHAYCCGLTRCSGRAGYSWTALALGAVERAHSQLKNEGWTREVLTWKTLQPGEKPRDRVGADQNPLVCWSFTV